MPRVFDNIEQKLLEHLRNVLSVSQRADFCVGYFNLRGWKLLAPYIDDWLGTSDNCCRLLIGMHRTPQEELKRGLKLKPDQVDQQQVLQWKKQLAQEFHEQLAMGIPTNEDEKGLRHLVNQLLEKKVQVKLFLRMPLHAKLYLLFRNDFSTPITGYLGSSNLTLSGLSGQGELNIDVLDQDACQKLSSWFEERWHDRWCLDISKELIEAIENSWARENELSPYYIYLKMAYHLSQEARAGLAEFEIPKEFKNQLFDYQAAAVKIAAHHVHKRNGVLLADVVGLGKTMMATALASILERDLGLETLIICPKNLMSMWEDYAYRYHLRGHKILSLSKVLNSLADLPRYRLLIIDESHNLRNREGKRYRVIQAYIEKNDSRCILLSATPYNKIYQDLSSQLRLFVPENQNLGIRPEKLLHEIGELAFRAKHQCEPHTLPAFEKSLHPDDWRELMRLFMVRRTRSFIKEHYAHTDESNGRKYLFLADGSRSYFPLRIPKSVTFASDQDQQYSQLYSDTVIEVLNTLNLPRYGLANYISPQNVASASPQEKQILDNLSRAGKQLMGFCRTNLFKRLESSGWSFLLSIKRHILRNYIFLHALDNEQPLPIGTQEAEMLDMDTDTDLENQEPISWTFHVEKDYQQAASKIYQQYVDVYQRRFKWIPPHFFIKSLRQQLLSDARKLSQIVTQCGEWQPKSDSKLNALYDLLTKKSPHEKVLIFTQYADTAEYLAEQLRERNLENLASVTGQTDDPTKLAWRFSPRSNDKTAMILPENELRILIATDVLSEGQNLQDAAIIVNYDLPWAIIRLIQRAGRIDRIGQQSENILCYSFLPAEGIESVIRIRGRVSQRLKENAEVVGADERFFDDQEDQRKIVDLYNEKSGILDEDEDSEVDLVSYAYQIWKNAIDQAPNLQQIIPNLTDLVYSAKNHTPTPEFPEGVLLYMHSADGSDALAWLDKDGQPVTESQFAILKAAWCTPQTPARQRWETHHDLVRQGMEWIVRENKYVGGQLGRPSGARYRTYERLKVYAECIRGTIFEAHLPELEKSIDEIYRFPLSDYASHILNRQLRAGLAGHELFELIVSLREEGRFCLLEDTISSREPRVICSLGLQA